MLIKTTCPRCHNTYQVDQGLRGKRMRCPHAGCRSVFEVGADDHPPAPAPGARQAGSVGDVVSMLEAEAVSPPPTPAAVANVQDVVPLLAAEAAQPVEAPPQSVRSRKPTPPPKPPTAPTAPVERSASDAPPPIRARGTAPPVAPLAPPLPPPAVPARVRAAPPIEKRRPAPPPPPMPAAAPAPPMPAAPPPPAPEPSPAADYLEMLRELGLSDLVPSSAEGPPEPAPRPTADEPVEYAAGTWDLPPVRRGDAAAAVLDPVPNATAPAPAVPAARPRKKRRRSLVMIALMLAVLGGVAWGGFRLVGERQAGNEAERHKKALREYDDRSFADAAALFRDLARDFPHSPSLKAYRFLAELSDVRDPIHGTQPDLEATKRSADRLEQFTKYYKGDPLLAEKHADLAEDFRRLGDAFREQAREQFDAAALENARLAYARAAEYKPASAARANEVTADLDRLARAIIAHELKQRTVAHLKRELAQPSGAAVQTACLVAAAAGLTADPEVKALLEQLPKAHRAAVKYTPARAGPGPDALAGESDPGLLIVPMLEKPRPGLRPGGRPVLALARGVLYALEPDRGDVRWAVRVGADTTALPLWLPSTAAAPEQVLVLSSDSESLSGLDARTGATRWCRRLTAPCLGQPVLVADRAFVPTVSGRVEEVEVSGGALLGYYDLGQTLTGAGVRQPGTNLLYFPADSFCVYVLDVGQRICAGILYTNHPSGSLRGAPLVVRGTGQNGYLVLGQADGLDRMRLRTFALPVAGPDAEALAPELTLDGWAWFAPSYNGEQLALVTDAGDFVVATVERRTDGGAPLTPLFRERLASPDAARSGRAQLVHADGEQFWVLAHGGLYRLQATFTRAVGPRLISAGAELTALGSPLHDSQAATDERGRTVLYLVTQSVGGRACLATAVDARQGEVLWQRQLGMVRGGPPVAVGERILAADLDGALFLFNPSAKAAEGHAWRVSGRRLGGAGGPFHMLASADGASVYAVAAVRRDAGPAVSVRAFHKGKAPDPAQEFALQAPLAGTPAVVGDALILPLGNGILVRQPLGGGAAVTGPNWRALGADENAEGHVVALGGDEFLVTDGSSGLTRISCDGKAWDTGDKAKVAGRIVSAPAVLRGGELQVCVADTENTVTLLRGEGLQAVQQWKLSGRITAGPFVRSGGIGCILKRNYLVWLRPGEKESPWNHPLRGDVVGEPQLVDGVLLIADERGEFHALSPSTGDRIGPGYRLKANVAPMAAPVAFGPDRLFAPLSDGTVLLLSRRHLHLPAQLLRGFPLLR